MMTQTTHYHRAASGRSSDASRLPGRTLPALLVAVLVLVATACGNDDNVAPGSRPAPPPTGFTHNTATVNGLSMHYVMGGQGEPVLLIHGYPQTWYEWNRIMPQLGQRYTVIAPDLRGAGETTRPNPPAGYDKRTMAEDIHQLVRSLGLPRVKVVAHDIGMWVAYAYAAAYPQEVERLVLMDAPIPGIDPVWSLAAGDFRYWHLGFHQDRVMPERLTQGRERDYLTDFYRKLAYNKDAFTEDEINEFVRAYSQPGAMTAGFEWYRAIPTDVEHNRENARRRLTMPVLAMGGQMSGAPIMLATVSAVADNVRESVIPQAGHWLVEEQPEHVLRELLAFLD